MNRKMVYKKKRKVKKVKKVENAPILKCFVMGCTNNELMNGKPLHYFRVPEGIEGFFWAKAVKSRRKNYEQIIDLLSSRTSEEQNSESQPLNIEYCCEVHFNIETDVEKIIDESGSVEYKIKPGIFPTIKPRPTKRLWEIEGILEDFVETYEMPETNAIANTTNFIVVDVESNSEEYLEIVNFKPENDFVDTSTLIYQQSVSDTQGEISIQQSPMETNSYDQQDDMEENSNDEQVELKYEPIMPLIVDLMQRKSLFYMGLQPSSFASFLQITTESTKLTKAQIMLTLRKLRLNEDFEVLGDLFDIDRSTAEQYYEECSTLVSDAIKNLNPNTSQMSDTLEPIIKVEPCEMSENPLLIEQSYECSIEVKADEQDEEDVSSDSSDSSSDSEFDPDFDSDGFESTGSSNYSKSSETFLCPLCPKYVHRLDNHINRFHLSPLNINKTICGLCMKKFESPLILRAHQTDCHNGDAFACDLCKSTFKNYSYIKRHIFRKHSKLKPHLCHICGVGYGDACKLKQHMERKHENIRRHSCQLCAKKYFTAASLQTHIYSTHTGERKFKCAVKGCGKSFWKKSYLTDHQNVHSQPKFTCDLCSKTFSFKQNLGTHKKKIHGLM